MEQVLIRAEIIGENAAGQKHIRLLANNADGIHFWTDDKSIVRSIEPQRKKGKWKQVRVNGFTPGGNSLSVCSECGWEFGTHMIYPDYNFCPNCGADMTEGE